MHNATLRIILATAAISGARAIGRERRWVVICPAGVKVSPQNDQPATALGEERAGAGAATEMEASEAKA